MRATPWRFVSCQYCLVDAYLIGRLRGDLGARMTPQLKPFQVPLNLRLPEEDTVGREIPDPPEECGQVNDSVV
jgi:hypothetical protein